MPFESREGNFMDIILSNSSGVPIYEQIEEQIKSQIMTGELVEGEALPSMRVLAKDLKISIKPEDISFTFIQTPSLTENNLTFSTDLYDKFDTIKDNQDFNIEYNVLLSENNEYNINIASIENEFSMTKKERNFIIMN